MTPTELYQVESYRRWRNIRFCFIRGKHAATLSRGHSFQWPFKIRDFRLNSLAQRRLIGACNESPSIFATSREIKTKSTRFHARVDRSDNTTPNRSRDLLDI